MNEKINKIVNVAMIVNIVANISASAYMITINNYINAVKWLVIAVFNFGLFFFIKRVESQITSLNDNSKRLEDAIKQAKELMVK